MDIVGPRMASEQRSRAGSRRTSDLELFGAAAAATAALDRLNQGIALTDRARQLQFVNRLAQAICSETDGLRIRGGELIATGMRDASRLQGALDRAITVGHEASLRLERPSRRRALSVLITPLRVRAGPPDMAAAFVLVTIADPDRSSLPPGARLMQAYGLTPSEAGVTRLLLAGLGIAALALRLGIGIETARTHLRRVLAKTGTHRQADLVRLLLREFGGVA